MSRRALRRPEECYERSGAMWCAEVCLIEESGSTWNLCLLFALAFLAVGALTSYLQAASAGVGRFWHGWLAVRHISVGAAGQAFVFLFLALVWSPLLVPLLWLALTSLIVAVSAWAVLQVRKRAYLWTHQR